MRAIASWLILAIAENSDSRDPAPVKIDQIDRSAENPEATTG
jgi:hypothetical protein